MQYTIDIVDVGRCEVRGPEVYWMSCWEDWLPLQFHMFVARSKTHTVVINTGPPDDLTQLNAMWTAYLGDPRGALDVASHQKPTAQLQRLGIDPAKVDALIISPFQQYSISNVAMFPNARIMLSRHGWLAFHAPPTPVERAARQQSIPDDVLCHLLTDAWPRLVLMDDDHDVLPGLNTFRTGGHHPESTAILIDTPKGRVAISDCIFHYGNIENDHVLGIAENLDECTRAYRRIREVADIVLPPYDPAIQDRHPANWIG